MQYQILIEHLNQNGFVASVIGIPDCTATGSTEDEAIASVRQSLSAKLSQAKIVSIEIESPVARPEQNPLLKNAGHLNKEDNRSEENPFNVAALKDDPTFDDFMEKLQQIRREGNAGSFDDGTEAKEAAAG
jgi:hypothetical protein